MKVYVIGREIGPCKIGISKNPRERLRALQTGCPFRLSVLYEVFFFSYLQAFDCEQVAYRAYLDRHLHGEWFAITGAQARRIIDEIVKEENVDG